MMHGQEFNFIIGRPEPRDAELFFGDEPVEIIDDLTIRWPQLLKRIGIFKSTGDAMKNGWNKDIPSGFSDMRIGKLRVRITVLKLL